jgi:hypothetical protein
MQWEGVIWGRCQRLSGDAERGAARGGGMSLLAYIGRRTNMGWGREEEDGVKR